MGCASDANEFFTKVRARYAADKALKDTVDSWVQEFPPKPYKRKRGFQGQLASPATPAAAASRAGAFPDDGLYDDSKTL